MKKLINVLSAIEKDLRIIASNAEISHDSKKIDVTIETKNNGSNKLMSINELISLIRESDGTELITLKVLTN